MPADKEVYLLLDKSPFYGESGGQIGDKGLLRNENGQFKVLDTKYSKYCSQGMAQKLMSCVLKCIFLAFFNSNVQTLELVNFGLLLTDLNFKV